MVPDEPVPIWKVIKSLVGQDLTRVSMPVILNEPQSALSVTVESYCALYPYLEQAAACDDPVRRLMLVAVVHIALINGTRVRKRKPFNPMLGESYEMVTENFRALV